MCLIIQTHHALAAVVRVFQCKQMGGRVVIHHNKSNEELALERRETYLRLSMEERFQETIKMYRLTMLFSQEKVEKRKCVQINMH